MHQDPKRIKVKSKSRITSTLNILEEPLIHLNLTQKKKKHIEKKNRSLQRDSLTKREEKV